jgi:hypothetical protein
MSSTLTDLTAATTWSGTDLFYATVSGNSRKIAASSFWVRDTININSQVNSTNVQTLRIYRTFTDSSNYERLALTSAAGRFELTAETAGTGQDDINLRLIPAGGGQVEISTAPTGSNCVLRITTSNSSANNPALFILAGSLTSGQYLYNTIGRATSTGNAFGLRFKYVGDNDPTNEFNVEFYGSEQPLSCYNNGSVRLFQTLATPAGGSSAARLTFGSTAGFGIYIGSGAPTTSATKGSLYLRSDGTTTNDRLYVNNGTTNWIAVTTAS